MFKCDGRNFFFSFILGKIILFQKQKERAEMEKLEKLYS